jgi:hypothetical protein
MYAVKIIWHNDDKDGQPIELLAGEKILYENVICNNSKEEHSIYVKKDFKNFQMHGHEPLNEITEPYNLVFMRLWVNNDWERHVIRDAWIFVMLNGKTIEKITAD